MEEKLLTLPKPPAMEVLANKLNKHQQPQMVVLSHTSLEPQAMEDTLHQQLFHQQALHMFHNQSHTQHHRVDTLPTHMSQPHMDMKPSPMTQSQPETVDQ